MKFLLTILLVTISISFAYADKWEYLGNTRSGDNFYLDKSSIKKKDNLGYVTEKQVFNFPQISRDGNIYDQTILFKIYDCSNKNFTIKKVTGQDNKGNPVFNENFDKYYEGNPSKKWLKVSPSSIFFKSYETACK